MTIVNTLDQVKDYEKTFAIDTRGNCAESQSHRESAALIYHRIYSPIYSWSTLLLVSIYKNQIHIIQCECSIHSVLANINLCFHRWVSNEETDFLTFQHFNVQNNLNKFDWVGSKTVLLSNTIDEIAILHANQLFVYLA